MEPKYHLVLGGFILCILVFAYLSIPSGDDVQNAKPIVSSQRAIEITHATWGANCNGEKEYQKNKDGEREYYTVDEKRDNVLMSVTKRCSGRRKCSVEASEDFLEKDAPSKYCPPELKILYRCFDIDAAHELRVEFDESDVIDCRQE